LAESKNRKSTILKIVQFCQILANCHALNARRFGEGRAGRFPIEQSMCQARRRPPDRKILTSYSKTCYSGAPCTFTRVSRVPTDTERLAPLATSMMQKRNQPSAVKSSGRCPFAGGAPAATHNPNAASRPVLQEAPHSLRRSLLASSLANVADTLFWPRGNRPLDLVGSPRLSQSLVTTISARVSGRSSRLPRMAPGRSGITF